MRFVQILDRKIRLSNFLQEQIYLPTTSNLLTYKCFHYMLNKIFLLSTHIHTITDKNIEEQYICKGY